MIVDPTTALRVLTSVEWPQVLVSLAGELDLATAGYLVERLLPLLPEHPFAPPQFVIDVSAVTFVDVAGLRGLLAVADAVAAGGGTVVLRRTPEAFAALVRLIGTAHRLPMTDGDGP